MKVYIEATLRCHYCNMVLLEARFPGTEGKRALFHPIPSEPSKCPYDGLLIAAPYFEAEDMPYNLPDGPVPK